MPRRRWRAQNSESLAGHQEIYPCPTDCPVHHRMMELFGLLTYDIVNEVRANNRRVPLAKQMVNGSQMRGLIADFLSFIAESIRVNGLPDNLRLQYQEDKANFFGLVLGCLSDLCFNMEYIRRITDSKWSYCNRDSRPKVFYPYLGVCPKCVLHTSLREASLGSQPVASLEEAETRARYFGNKVQGHHVGRIGERIITFIIDLISKAHNPAAVSGLVVDDQHDVDSVFIFDGIAILAQIKASPLVLFPIVVRLEEPLTNETSPDTGLPLQRANHTFVSIPTADRDLEMYFALDDATINLGPKTGDNFPYETLRRQLNVEVAVNILSNWVRIYRSFEIPKVLREGDDVKRAYLTSGWGDPIDDNKTKAGLARSDNMMKGTYACLKYGAYYGQECVRGTVKAALIANIDPAHQYAEYLQKLEDIRWGHDRNFVPVPERSAFFIDGNNLTYLFDSVFTFNRQILNDPKTKQAWNLELFADKLINRSLDELLDEWR